MHTILLLEDDVSLNRGITLTLQRAGYLVLSAFTLSEAKKHLALAKEKISLIICGFDRNKRVSDLWVLRRQRYE